MRSIRRTPPVPASPVARRLPRLGATRRLRRLITVIAIAGGGVILGACGIPLSGASQALSQSQIPAGLEQGRATPTTTPSSSKVVPIPVFFFNSSYTRLVETTADEPKPTSAAEAASEALDLLTYGPTAVDTRLGLVTALQTSPQPTPQVQVNLKTGVATVDFDISLEELFGPPLYEAEAQIVYTLTDPRFGVHAVLFTFEGVEQAPYFPPSGYPDRAVSRADYRALAPLPVTTTTTTTVPPTAKTVTGHRTAQVS